MRERAPAIPQVLLVEDNPADVRLTMEAFSETGAATRVYVAKDGDEALELIQGLPGSLGGRIPDLILLDLNLPRRSGHEVLNAIKQDPELHKIPVVVLTNSSRPKDMEEAYGHHVNCYVTKPKDLDNFLETVQAIQRFWLDVARIPTRGRFTC